MPVSKHFEIRTINEWKRLHGKTTEKEPRPHIIPLTEAAVLFVEHQLHLPSSDPDCVFGPFYTGFGYVKNDDGNIILAFRLKAENTEEALRLSLNEVEAVFHRFVQTTIAVPVKS